ncbi:MAG: hypothetical protein EHM21_00240 [Chloroflexi bacterium]|nr:MAG: hypothetical protein EHM21_00240 [Chloroflexota bacterium]
MSSAYPKLQIGGPVGRYLDAVTEQWLLVAPLANPAMLEMFAGRDSGPYRNLLPWSGEFAGKYLTAAVQVYRVTRDPRLLEFLKGFVARLVRLQDSDGYLGPWPPDSRLTNFSPHHGPNGLLTWDTWGHYHLMIGLLLWHEEVGVTAGGDPAALECVCGIGDMICRKYLGNPAARLVDTGSTEMNLAPVHSLAKLYRLTGKSDYLDMALQIVEEFGAQSPNGPLAGDYFRLALAGKSLHEMPKPRWESLHAILGMVEIYKITGEERYRAALENIWWGIVAHDRHNNGGFSSGEQATGNPYDPGAIETCCTIAWMVFSAEMLRLTGDSLIADELELSLFNSVLGMHALSGRWATYNTPMDGARFASAHAIVFQARSGSPELNCCSVNSSRGLGLISEWALLQEDDRLTLNYYGYCTLQAALAGGQEIEIRQETDYPRSGSIRLRVAPAAPLFFSLQLRIPYWSQNTRVNLNGERLESVQPGRYFEIRREWQPGDQVEIELDFSPHFWPGERECQGLVSIYLGPLLLAYDQRYNQHLRNYQAGTAVLEDPSKVTRDRLPAPTVQTGPLELEQVTWDDWHPPLLLLRAQTDQGEPVYLCDFASAGATGSLYRSWLPYAPARDCPAFSRENPLRSLR